MSKSGASANPGVRTQIKKEEDEKLEKLLKLQTALYTGILKRFKPANFISDEEAAKITHGKPIKIAKKLGTKEVGCSMNPLAEGGMTFVLLSNDPQSVQVLKESLDEYVKAYNAWRDASDKDYDLEFELEVEKLEEVKPLLQKLEPGIKISRVSIKNDSGAHVLSKDEMNDIRQTLPKSSTPSSTQNTKKSKITL